MTTITAFATALAGLTITGVTTKLAEPPASLNTADLPASFPKRIEIAGEPMTFGYHGGWPTLRSDLFIAVNPTAQGTQAANYTLVKTLMDASDAALRAAVGVLGKGPLTYSIRGGDTIINVAGTDYWAIIISVEAHG
jgi:hypothetical protein